MDVRLEQFQVPRDDPWRNDKLGRKTIAEDVLTPIVCNASQPMVLSISAPWGHGKTCFVNMWKQHLENEGHLCIYFNAWETDYIDDPLIALVGEITEELGEDRLGKHAGIGERLRQGGALVAKYAIPLVMQLLTAGVVRSDDVAEAVADVTTDMISKRIDDYKDAKQSVVQFKSTLAELTQSLGEEEEGRHVIFFVDELDRCRPTYAVEVLEIIKHLFDVGGVVFILAVTPEQLQHSVKALYGEGTDAIRYLQRFIDLEYRLPQPELNRYVDLLMNRLGLKSPKLQLPIDSVRAGIIAIAPVFGLSLRQLEKIVFQLALAARCKHQLSDASCWFLFFLLAMQWVKQDLYSSFVEKEDMNAVIRLAKEIQNTPNYRVQEHVDAAVHIYYMSETEINDRLGEFARKHKEYQYLSEFSFNVVRRAPAVLALLEGFNLED